MSLESILEKEGAMEQILEELSTVPGVNGAFVFHAMDGIVARSLPAVFKDQNLIQIGKSLAKIHFAGTMSVKALSEVTLFYEESIVIVRQLIENCFLVVLFDPSHSFNLLTMSLNLIQNDLSDTIMRQKAANDAVKNNSAHMPEDSYTVEELLHSSPMAATLQEMRLALARVMGPISKVIFTNALNEWAVNGRPGIASISALVAILEKEIDDPELFGQYQARIAKRVIMDN